MQTPDVDSIVNYWNSQPCNIKHSNLKIGTLEYFESVKDKRYTAESHIPKFAQFGSYKNKRILEIGCGIGTDAIEFARHGAQYVGIDLSSESINLTKKRFDVYNLKGEFYNIDAADDLSFLGKFDLVYSFGVIHHYPNVEKIIDNVKKLLKPKGIFKFMVYAKNSWKYAMILKDLDQAEAQPNCPYVKVYTNSEIEKLLYKKLSINYIKQDHCFMYKIEEYKKGIFELEPWFFVMSDEMKSAVKEYLGWHLLVEAKNQ